jgi:hypothetical protein
MPSQKLKVNLQKVHQAVSVNVSSMVRLIEVGKPEIPSNK